MKWGDWMDVLGVILIVTGIMVFLSGYKIIRSTHKMVRTNTILPDYQPSEQQQRRDEKTEQEYKKLVKKGMKILYVVGVTCMLVGILMILL